MKYLITQLLVGILCLASLQLSYAAPITGNPSGKVTLVEYYDYECPHCRRMESVIDRLQAEYPELKVVHRVTPLLNPESRPIASFALAAKSQGKWFALHQQLMASPTAPTLSDAESLAKALGLNTQQLFSTMQSKHIQKQIMTNIKLADRHAINGGIYLPLLEFGQSSGRGQPIVLTGEQPYTLLSAIVQQLGSDAHVQMVKSKR